MSKKMDSAWSLAVRERDRHFCQWLGHGCKGKAIHAHHIFSRRYKRLRWDIDNGVAVCAVCHDWIERHSVGFMDRIEVTIPKLRWAGLQAKLEKNYNIKR